ncbi:hypothetical protein B4072_3819 [Bacillus subtilis]|nr:hypothetical protein B4069_3791 [Bacillus subtilis]KIN45551.1 hypothetical protein B4072_3819 [Bacillus subtilis]
MKNLDILTKSDAFFVIFIHIRKSEQKKRQETYRFLPLPYD